MAELRLMLIALASCAASEAAPPPAASASNFTAPKGWVVDAALAKTAATAAAGDTITVLGSDAWSEPSRGCYAIWIDVAGGTVPVEAAADQLVAALTNQKATLRDVQKPAAGEAGTLALAFDRAPYHGKLRAELVKTGEIRALACMWNQREPKACEAGCAGLLGAVK